MKSCCIDRQINDKSVFDYSKFYLADRNKSFHATSPLKEKSIWERLPPDFRLQSFQPHPIKRRLLLPTKIRSKPSEESKDEKRLSVSRSSLFTSKSDCGQSKTFISHFKIQRPYSAKIEFCKHGMYPKLTYQSPKPFDHRGLKPIKDLGLPEFTVKTDKDPGNILLNTNALGITYGPLNEEMVFRETTGKSMYESVKKDSKWNSENYLPHAQWPNVPKEFTRHRIIYQDPHAAFLERVETVLTEKWKQENLLA